MNVFASEQFHDPELTRALLRRLERSLDGPFRFMEVCGTHTVAIFQSGLHSLLPKELVHISGPGCPVCATHESEVALFIEIARHPGVIVATFGDLMRVPGPGGSSLKAAKAEGGRVEVVYSPPDALKIARENKDSLVVFLAVGFETTAPTVAGTVLMAEAQGIENFAILSFHKLVPPALRALLADPDASLDGFILPGHVSAVLGADAYGFLADDFHVSGVVTGFEPLDVLQALLMLVDQKKSGKPAVLNQYTRVVTGQGNARARAVMDRVFRPADALWRGIGPIPGSGLAVRPEYSAFDAMSRLALSLPEARPLPGCRCGDVLKGKMAPNQCPLFRKACTPATPVGPCMVSTEGSCAAYFKYRLED